ncbi:hypothetical protein HY463_01105 [Candidatus Peregrinibacteria bacterium]|nr:hypothetical protein [Candidatus Peregrinibacteria bacterium]
MTDFNRASFQKRNFSAEQIAKYFASATKNLRIAEQIAIPEVRFKFSYDALIKIAITLIAKHGFKVINKVGHHIIILKKLSEILEDTDIEVIANKMRTKRNLDLYDEGLLITEKEADQYFKFVNNISKQAEKIIF